MLVAVPAQAQQPEQPRVKDVASTSMNTQSGVIRLLSSVNSVNPGEPFWVGIMYVLRGGWHTYADPSGDAGMPPSFTWTLPEGFTAGPIKYMKPTEFKEGGFTTYGYKTFTYFPVLITPPEKLNKDEIYSISLKASWLACKEQCIPEQGMFTIQLPVSTKGTDANRYFAPLQSVGEGKPVQPSGKPTDKKGPAFSGGMFPLVMAAFSAFIGGIILNLMPCVFPVLSLKCLAVVRTGSMSPRQARHEGLAYAAGILVCFTLIAGGLIALQRGGEALGWGFQMQSPVFVTVLALLMFVIGLNLSGMFTMPALFGNVGRELTQEPTVKGSFATGVLATLVATPCTAPFMASAIGYALAQPAIVALVIFEMLGLGLALPFLLISFFPRLLKAMPRPGAWMEAFQQFLAFPLYASSIWLLWVLTQQSGANGMGAALLCMLALVLALWVLDGRSSPKRKLLVFVGVVVCIVATLSYVHRLPPQAASATLVSEGEPFDETRLNALRQEGKPVFVDVTAAWCITCRVNHFSTLSTSAVQQLFKEKGVTFMVADWTNRNDTITRYLSSFGYSGVPLYVYYPPRGEPRVLPQLLTVQSIRALVK